MNDPVPPSRAVMRAGTSPAGGSPPPAGALSRPSWEECAAAGMTHTEAARARGVTRAAASHAARRMGLVFADGRKSAAHAERMRALHDDPSRNPLVQLTPAERADYDTLVKRGGLSRAEAFRAIARVDLIRGPA